MSRSVITEGEHQNTYSACRIMHENNIGCVVIVDKNGANSEKPVCIITERDVVHELRTLNRALLDIPLHDIMSNP